LPDGAGSAGLQEAGDDDPESLPTLESPLVPASSLGSESRGGEPVVAPLALSPAPVLAASTLPEVAPLASAPVAAPPPAKALPALLELPEPFDAELIEPEPEAAEALDPELPAAMFFAPQAASPLARDNEEIATAKRVRVIGILAKSMAEDKRDTSSFLQATATSPAPHATCHPAAHPPPVTPHEKTSRGSPAEWQVDGPLMRLSVSAAHLSPSATTLTLVLSVTFGKGEKRRFQKLRTMG